MLNYEKRLEQLHDELKKLVKMRETYLQRFDSKIAVIEKSIADLQKNKEEYDELSAKAIELVASANKTLTDIKAWEVQDPDNASIEFIEKENEEELSIQNDSEPDIKETSGIHETVEHDEPSGGTEIKSGTVESDVETAEEIQTENTLSEPDINPEDNEPLIAPEKRKFFGFKRK